MKKIFILGLVVFMAMIGSLYAADKYPGKDITNIVVWGAGGGTDTCNRIISAEMAKILGVDINVINKPGGVAGSLGMSYASSRPADGYTLCGLSESCVIAGIEGGWSKRMNIWDIFIVGSSPDIISVTTDTPYKSLKELIEAAKASPGSIRAGASGAGSIHHLNLLALEDGTGAKFTFVNYNGSGPSQEAAVNGEVSLVITSIAEQQQLIKSGKLRPLAMLIPNSFEMADVGTIPSSFVEFPGLAKYLPISQAIGFAIRKEATPDVKSTLKGAFDKAMASEKVKSWAKNNYYLLSGKSGTDAAKEFDKLESIFAWTLWDLDFAKVNPAYFGIPRLK